MEDLIPDWYECRDSPLHGKGIFAKKDIPMSTLIMNDQAIWTIPKEKFTQCYPFRANTVGMDSLLSLCYEGTPGENEDRVELRRHVINGFDGGWEEDQALDEREKASRIHPVSYTHLTLPTKRIV